MKSKKRFNVKRLLTLFFALFSSIAMVFISMPKAKAADTTVYRELTDLRFEVSDLVEAYNEAGGTGMVSLDSGWIFNAGEISNVDMATPYTYFCIASNTSLFTITRASGDQRNLKIAKLEYSFDHYTYSENFTGVMVVVNTNTTLYNGTDLSKEITFESGKTPFLFGINKKSGTGGQYYPKDLVIKVYEAVDVKAITLNNDGATTAGTDKIYYFESKFYLDAACTKEMTATKNPITKPTKTGYDFDGYYKGSTQYINENGYLVNTVYSEDMNLTASWIAHQTTITFNKVLADATGTSSVVATYGEAMPAITPPEKGGYTFDGYYIGNYDDWYYSSDGSSTREWNIDEVEYTLTAEWFVNSYNITLDFNGGIPVPYYGYYETNAGQMQPQSQSFGLSSPTKTGYDFAGWETTYPGTSMDGLTLRIAADTYGNFTVTALWTPKKYELTFDLGEGSGTAPTGLLADYETDMPAYGEDAPTLDGYTFDGFYDEENGVGTKYYNADLSSANKWDKTNGATLYAFYKKTIIYEVIGYNGDYDRTAKKVTINLTDPSDTSYIKFSNDGGETYTVNYEDRPAFTNVGEYDVYYQIEAPGYTTVTRVEHISIKRVDRSNLEALIDTATAFYNEIKDDYPTVANEISIAINHANDFNEEDNLLPEEVEEERLALLDAFNTAKGKVAIEKIDAIQPVTCTDECKALIDEALNYYNDLTDAQKEIVGEDAYKELLHDLEIYTHVKNFYNLVEAISAPTNTKAYKDQVSAARNAYNALTDDEEKPLVDENILKTLEIYEEISNYFAKVNDVTNATNYSDYVSKVATARSTYNALSNDAKAMISKVDYQVLLDQEAAKEAIDKVNNIGNVEYTDGCKTKIDTARVGYDTLTDSQKAFVNNINYQELVDAEHIYEAMEKIENIGEVKNNPDSKEKIKEAREYYDSLTEGQKNKLGDDYLKRLADAENKYKSLNKGVNGWLIALIILACLLVLGGLFFIILIIKRKKDDDNNQNGNKEANEEVENVSDEKA